MIKAQRHKFGLDSAMVMNEENRHACRKRKVRFKARLLLNLMVLYFGLAFLDAPSQANSTTVRGFYNMCYDQTKPEKVFCLGFVAGIVDALTIPDLTVDDKKSCLPVNRVNYGEFFDIAMKYIEVFARNPSLENVGAASIIAFGLRREFPCQ